MAPLLAALLAGCGAPPSTVSLAPGPVAIHGAAGIHPGRSAGPVTAGAWAGTSASKDAPPPGAATGVPEASASTAAPAFATVLAAARAALPTAAPLHYQVSLYLGGAKPANLVMAATLTASSLHLALLASDLANSQGAQIDWDLGTGLLLKGGPLPVPWGVPAQTTDPRLAAYVPILRNSEVADVLADLAATPGAASDAGEASIGDRVVHRYVLAGATDSVEVGFDRDAPRLAYTEAIEGGAIARQAVFSAYDPVEPGP